jgi:hypothetical protein
MTEADRIALEADAVAAEARARHIRERLATVRPSEATSPAMPPKKPATPRKATRLAAPREQSPEHAERGRALAHAFGIPMIARVR